MLPGLVYNDGAEPKYFLKKKKQQLIKAGVFIHVYPGMGHWGSCCQLSLDGQLWLPAGSSGSSISGPPLWLVAVVPLLVMVAGLGFWLWKKSRTTLSERGRECLPFLAHLWPASISPNTFSFLCFLLQGRPSQCNQINLSNVSPLQPWPLWEERRGMSVLGFTTQSSPKDGSLQKGVRARWERDGLAWWD